MPGLEEAAEVVAGVYLGGFAAAKEGLRSGAFQPDQFKVLTRYSGKPLAEAHTAGQPSSTAQCCAGWGGGGGGAGRLAPSGARQPGFPCSQSAPFLRTAGWAPGQLDEEVKRGVWFPVAASKAAILQHVALGGTTDFW